MSALKQDLDKLVNDMLAAAKEIALKHGMLITNVQVNWMGPYQSDDNLCPDGKPIYLASSVQIEKREATW